MTAGAGESLAAGALGKARAYQSGFENIASGLGSIYEKYRT
jgi:hypothetical protein